MSSYSGLHESLSAALCVVGTATALVVVEMACREGDCLDSDNLANYGAAWLWKDSFSLLGLLVMAGFWGQVSYKGTFFFFFFFFYFFFPEEGRY